MQGRTGVMVCAYIIHSRHLQNADLALKYYSQTRTMDSKVLVEHYATCYLLFRWMLWVINLLEVLLLVSTSGL